MFLLQNVARPENIWIQKVVSVAHAVMASINRMKVHSHACCAVWVKQRDQARQPHAKNVVTSAHLVNNWAPMAAASHAHEAHTVRKAFNLHAPLAHWVAPHQKLAPRPLRSAHCPSVCPAHT